LATERVVRRLAAILAADVAGYSRLMGADEEGTMAALKAIRREFGDPKIAEHRGRIVKTTGDGLLIEFGSVVDAMRCAVELQRGMAERYPGAPQEKRIEFRLGIHQGDIVVEEGDIFGDGVNIAARLEALAEPGAIGVSAVQEDAAGKLELAFEDLGEQQLKNIARPVRVFRVTLTHPPGRRGTPSPALRVAPRERVPKGVALRRVRVARRRPWRSLISRRSRSCPLRLRPLFARSRDGLVVGASDPGGAGSAGAGDHARSAPWPPSRLGRVLLLSAAPRRSERCSAIDRRKGVDFARRALEVAGDDPITLTNATQALAFFGEDIGA
jgi:class 3 adenylate cyclase